MLRQDTRVRPEAFTDAMARMVSGIAVVTAQRRDGRPCGLLVSSICSYSVMPPSVLVAIGQASRSYSTFVQYGWFGVHLLGRGQRTLADVFAGRGEDKFAGLDWGWDGVLTTEPDAAPADAALPGRAGGGLVPRLAAVPVYLACATTGVFPHGDHTVVIGAVVRVEVRAQEPLVYYRRRYEWRLDMPGENGHGERSG